MNLIFAALCAVLPLALMLLPSSTSSSPVRRRSLSAVNNTRLASFYLRRRALWGSVGKFVTKDVADPIAKVVTHPGKEIFDPIAKVVTHPGKEIFAPVAKDIEHPGKFILNDVVDPIVKPWGTCARDHDTFPVLCNPF